MHAVLRYLSAAANRFSHAASVSADGSIIAFGSHKFVAIWDLQDRRGVVDTITGHEGLVTCVEFTKSVQYLICGDDHGWLYIHQNQASGWRVAAKVKAHSAGISTLVEHDGTIVTGSSDAKLKIWSYSPLATENTTSNLNGATENGSAADSINERQVISTGKRFPLAIAMALLPSTTSHVLAVGMTHTSVKIYVRQDNQFVEAAVLSGHEDWVKTLAFSSSSNDLKWSPLTLASGSQDGTIRLWTVTPATEQQERSSNELEDRLLDEFEAALGDITGEESGKQISMKQHLIKVKHDSQQYLFHVTFDALLIGHDAGITSVAWNPLSFPPLLLSTSVDSSAILWGPTTFGGGTGESTQLWTNHQRFGDVGGQRLGGFVGGLWVSQNQVCAWGWNGGFRRWEKTEHWEEIPAVTGQAGPVLSADWEPQGRYLVSASSDQTVRVYGPSSATEEGWYELARAQTHGYDCVRAVFLSDLRLASISDEKVTRVFDAPGGFLRLVQNLGIKMDDGDVASRPAAANVPPLGLSNKALAEDDQHPSLGPLDRPRFEAELAAFTLWPEIEKIFGHGYESIGLAVSHSRKLIATACKATTPEHAVVRLYDTENFKPFGSPLAGHTLTVTRIAFNRDDRFILAVGKDRTWHLFERNADDNGYSPVFAAKGHARIIWDCCWMHEEDIFATASRDKTVKLWHASSEQGAKQKAVATIKFEEAATAVDFLPTKSDGLVLMAVGLENGEIQVHSAQKPFDQWTQVLTIPANVTHVDHVRSLSWRPLSKTEPERKCDYLASCGDDSSLRVIEINA